MNLSIASSLRGMSMRCGQWFRHLPQPMQCSDCLKWGIVLSQSLRNLRRFSAWRSLAGSFGAVLGGELWVVKMNIPEYAFGNRFNHDPARNRKLLVHRREVEELRLKTEAKGLTLVPLRLYLKGGRVKLELGVCRGKALHDKRNALKEKALKRDRDRGDC